MPVPHENSILNAREILRSAAGVTDEELGGLTVELARALLDASHAGAESNERERAERLQALLEDPVGQAFVSALTDRAHRSSNGARLVAEVNALAKGLGVPRSLPSWDRLELRALQAFGSTVPELTARAVRRRIYQDAAPYLAPAQPNKLAVFLAERKAQGLRVNVNHLGEEVLGDEDAGKYLEQYLSLLARPEVDTISVKLSSIDARVDVVAWERTLERLASKLERIYAAALANPVAGASGQAEPKLVYLDMEAYRDLELTAEVFMRVLSRPELARLTAGIVLQAYVPDSHAYQERLLRFGRERVERGGAPIRMRLVKGANLMLERIEASLRGLELPTYGTKWEVDASFRRMLLRGTERENAECVRLGVGSHNLFDIALTLLLRVQRGVESWVEPEMLEGMADPLRRVVQRLAGRVLVYAPSVDERDFPSAVAYLVRRLDENTSEDNFLRRSFAMRSGDRSFELERQRFVAALSAARDVSTSSRRTQQRTEVAPRPRAAGFDNEPDTDFSRSVNREWLGAALNRVKDAPARVLASCIGGTLVHGALKPGFDPSRPEVVPYEYEALERNGVVRAIGIASAAHAGWSGIPAERREELLLAVAQELRAARGELIGAMVLDAGKRAVEADAEVSEAIDFAEYYARQHARLRTRFVLESKGLVVVTPPWNFPLSIGLGSALAALVAGNVVLLKPPPETPLVLSLAVELCFRAGIPGEALGIVLCEDDAAEPLVTDPRVATVMLTGGTETAKLFRKLRPSLDLIAETGGKNAMIVSGMSDREQAVSHAVRAAFGHAGQKCSALSLLVLEREVYRSASFRQKLADAVTTLKVGSAWDLETFVTPLIHPPAGALARALSSLEDGESWLVEPARHADNPRLVGPAVRWGVRPGSFAHVTELFGPVLSVLEAEDVPAALELANATPYGLTAGLESLNAEEVELFLANMQAGNLYVNRPVTGAIVGRQPFGGHKASSFGAGYKAGGPNTLLGLVRVLSERTRTERPGLPLSRGPRRAPADAKSSRRRAEPPEFGALDEVIADTLRDAAKPEQERLARRLRSYETALHEELAVAHPQDFVLGHRDELVYRPCRVGLVVLPGVAELEILCTLVAIGMVKAEVTVYAASAWQSPLAERLFPNGVTRFERVEELVLRLAEAAHERIRVIGGDSATAFAAFAAAAPAVETGPVHDSGYVELRRYVVEQSRSLARHRHGNPSLYLALERSGTPAVSGP